MLQARVDELRLADSVTFEGYVPLEKLPTSLRDVVGVVMPSLGGEVFGLVADNLDRSGIRSTLVCTVEHTTNLHEVGRVLRFGLERAGVRGVSYQLATYCGRHVDPGNLENRATMPDVAKALVAQTGILAETEKHASELADYLKRSAETRKGAPSLDESSATQVRH